MVVNKRHSGKNGIRLLKESVACVGKCLIRFQTKKNERPQWPMTLQEAHKNFNERKL